MGALIQILGTGLVTGVVLFALNLLRDLYFNKAEKKAKKAKEAVLISNHLARLALDCQRILDGFEQVGTMIEWEHIDAPEFPDQSLVELANQYGEFSADIMQRIADLGLKMEAAELSEEKADFETTYVVETGFDIKEAKVDRLRAYSSEAISLAIELRHEVGLSIVVLEDIGLQGSST